MAEFVTSHSQQMANGTIWTALERFSIIGIQLVCTFVLARFLTPADFGLMGMLIVFTLIGNTISESGFSQALIREHQVSDLTFSTVFWTNLALSLIVYLALWIAAPWIAAFYHQPLLTQVSRATFLVIPFGAACVIQVTRYTRQLAFRRTCIITLISSIISCIVAILWAWHTHSVWALVLQNVLTYALRTLFYWTTSHWYPRMQYSISEVRRLFAFSRNLLVSYLIGTIFGNIYTLVIGRYYGATQTGYFTQADRFRMVASNSSTSVIQSVSYPILSRVHNEGGDLKSAYRKIILTALIAVGFAMTALMCVSQDLFQILMGSSEWRVAGSYLVALGVTGILFPLHSVNENILLVKGMGKTVLWLEVARRTIMVILLLIAVQLRVEYFVWSYALYSILLLFVNLYVCGRPIGYSMLEQLHDVLPILFIFLTMFIASEISNHYLALEPLAIRFTVTLFFSVLIGLALLWRHPAFVEVLSLIRNLIHRH